MRDDHSEPNPTGSSEPSSIRPRIPNHTLVRLLAQGGRGDVWLACDVDGTFRAVKVFPRERFASDDAFAWELYDATNFETIAPSQMDLVRISQVGQGEAQNYFYYTMDLADDENSAARSGISQDAFVPESYQPRTLQGEILRHGVFPAGDCVELGLRLSRALEALHRQQLVHAAIRSANLIYFQGAIKLGGLARKPESAGVQAARQDAYRPPEGAGTARADIYSLGKVLYEMATGNKAEQFPLWPSGKQFNEGLMLDLKEMIAKACAHDSQRRYASCEALSSDLLLLQQGRSIRQPRWLKKAAVFLGIAALASGGLIWWKNSSSSEKPPASPSIAAPSAPAPVTEPLENKPSATEVVQKSEPATQQTIPATPVEEISTTTFDPVSAVDIKAWRAEKTLFTEGFDSESQENWLIKKTSDDTAVIFGYDYSEMGIPSAPGSDRTLGLRLAANMALPKGREAVSLSPAGKTFSGNYRLKFQLWMNVNGPFPKGGPGSTQFITAGIGTSGRRLHWSTAAMSDEDGIWFSVNGDGDFGSGLDFYAYQGKKLYGFPEGVYAAGTQASARSNNDPYYRGVFPPGQRPPPEQTSRYPKTQIGAMGGGCVGMAWREMEILKMNDYVAWSIDGLLIAVVRIDAQLFSDNIFIGYVDAVESVADAPELCFAVIDNLVVEEIAPIE